MGIVTILVATIMALCYSMIQYATGLGDNEVSPLIEAPITAPINPSAPDPLKAVPGFNDGRILYLASSNTEEQVKQAVFEETTRRG